MNGFDTHALTMLIVLYPDGAGMGMVTRFSAPAAQLSVMVLNCRTFTKSDKSLFRAVSHSFFEFPPSKV